MEHHDGEDSIMLRGIDTNKDQTYFLMSIKSKATSGITLFPLGEMTKPEVRELAEELELTSCS